MPEIEETYGTVTIDGIRLDPVIGPALHGAGDSALSEGPPRDRDVHVVRRGHPQ
jgi:hypothetical protein